MLQSAGGDARNHCKYPYLFPGFPGCDAGTGLCTTLTIADRDCRELPSRELDRAIGLPGDLAVRAMTDVYMGELEALAEGNRGDVILVARPDTLDDVHLSAPAASAGAPQGRARCAGNGGPPLAANFHDLLTARALRLGIPLQILRRRSCDAAPGTQHLGRDRSAAARTRRPRRGTCTSRCTTRQAASPGACSARPPTCTPATSASRSTAPRRPDGRFPARLRPTHAQMRDTRKKLTAAVLAAGTTVTNNAW